MPDNCSVSGTGLPLNAPRTLASPQHQNLQRPQSPTSLESGLQATQIVSQTGKPASVEQTYQLAQTPSDPKVRHMSLA